MRASPHKNSISVASVHLIGWRLEIRPIAAGRRARVAPELKRDIGIQAARTIFGKCFFDAENRRILSIRRTETLTSWEALPSNLVPSRIATRSSMGAAVASGLAMIGLGEPREVKPAW